MVVPLISRVRALTVPSFAVPAGPKSDTCPFSFFRRSEERDEDLDGGVMGRGDKFGEDGVRVSVMGARYD